MFTCAIITLSRFTNLTLFSLSNSLILLRKLSVTCHNRMNFLTFAIQFTTILVDLLLFRWTWVLGSQNYYYLWYQVSVWMIFHCFSLLLMQLSTDATLLKLAFSKCYFYISSSVTFDNPFRDYISRSTFY